MRAAPVTVITRLLAECAGGGTDEQLRVGDADDNMALKLLRRQVEVIKMIVQPLLSDVQAKGDLVF